MKCIAGCGRAIPQNIHNRKMCSTLLSAGSKVWPQVIRYGVLQVIRYGVLLSVGHKVWCITGHKVWCITVCRS